MSAYSDWKVGALTDDEYKVAMNRECADDYEEDFCCDRDCSKCDLDCDYREDMEDEMENDD